MGYITENGEVHLDRLERIFTKLGDEEVLFFPSFYPFLLADFF